jgi:hypothetical protein
MLRVPLFFIFVTGQSFVLAQEGMSGVLVGAVTDRSHAILGDLAWNAFYGPSFVNPNAIPTLNDPNFSRILGGAPRQFQFAMKLIF